MGIRMLPRRKANLTCAFASERQYGGGSATKVRITRAAQRHAKELRRRVTAWAPLTPHALLARPHNATRRPWTTLGHTRLARFLPRILVPRALARRLTPAKAALKAVLSGRPAGSVRFEPLPGRRGPDATP